MTVAETLPEDALVTVAIAVSRVEALVMASMLRSAGILVHIDGDQHASVEVISLALGGHRLLVPAWQWQDASSVIREAGAPLSWEFCAGPQRAILRFLTAYFGLWIGIMLAGWLLVPALPKGAMVVDLLRNMPFTILAVRANPQGPPDFYLAPKSD